MKFNIIVAIDYNNGISKEGKIPWNEPYDMEFFKDITSAVKDPINKNAVIMGTNTWKTLKRPLRNRLNMVLSNTLPEKYYDVDISKEEIPLIFNSFDKTLEYIKIRNKGKMFPKIENIFIIGGAQIYNLALKHPKCKYIYYTKIYKNYNCDNFFPDYDKSLYKTKLLKVKDNLIIYRDKKIREKRNTI